ncbi:hypothetical protein OPV22_004097 [Ensete ventricosum]|uniref:Secreted protein n=1 Tax=Ensete ventricosum TaxID=4639 RepID=A0AAV8S2F9_ENSVE|nr:hypothetical protein OPV22_004097 [Ensete ventricosum]
MFLLPFSHSRPLEEFILAVLCVCVPSFLCCCCSFSSLNSFLRFHCGKLQAAFALDSTPFWIAKTAPRTNYKEEKPLTSFCWLCLFPSPFQLVH